MIKESGAVLALVASLAACAPESPTPLPSKTAGASPSPTARNPSAQIPVEACPILGVNRLPVGNVSLEKVCGVGAGIRTLVEGDEKTPVLRGYHLIESLGGCVLNPVLLPEDGTDYYAFVQPNKELGPTAAEVTAYAPYAISSPTKTQEVVFRPDPAEEGYVATFANEGTLPVARVVTTGSCQEQANPTTGTSGII